MSLPLDTVWTDANVPVGDNLSAWCDLILPMVRSYLREDVERAVISPGNTTPWDECQCGMLALRVVSVVGASSMSNPPLQAVAPLFQVRMAVLVTRCAAVLDDGGNVPTPADLKQDSDAVKRDRIDVLNALMTGVRNIPGMASGSFRVEDWLPQGPNGGCVGGETTFTFTMNECITDPNI